MAGAAKGPGTVRQPAPKPGPPHHRAAVPESTGREPAGEPVWLVRAVVVLFLIGFAAFLAREVRGLLEATDASRTTLYWSAAGVGLAVGLVVGAVVAFAVAKRR